MKTSEVFFPRQRSYKETHVVVVVFRGGRMLIVNQRKKNFDVRFPVERDLLLQVDLFCWSSHRCRCQPIESWQKARWRNLFRRGYASTASLSSSSFLIGTWSLSLHRLTLVGVATRQAHRYTELGKNKSMLTFVRYRRNFFSLAVASSSG